jgi:hypothetical protein
MPRNGRVTLLTKIAIAVFSGCTLLIGIESGYWIGRPHSYSSCESLETAISVHPSEPITPRQLTHDAEFVEDLGIRYADARFGPRSGHFESMEGYGRRRDACIAQLFQLVARNDAVTDNQVRASLTHRPIEFDLAVVLSFLIIYSWLANALSFQIWHSQAQDDVERRAKIISVYAAILLGLTFVMLGEAWCDTMETIRLGNGHESYRGERVPWVHHYYLEYVGGAAIFCGAIMLHRRAARLESPADRIES